MKYIGSELELFQHARNWKNYWTDACAEYVQGDVLEVGAGIGSSTQALLPKCTFTSWSCIEPDASLLDDLISKKANGLIPNEVECTNSLLADLSAERKFDTILYIDVIEHIEDDRKELQEASQRLRKGGMLIILVPAHQSLYSPFDQRIGHFRRYNKNRLTSVIPEEMDAKRLRYLDSIGLLASSGNKLLLRRSEPSIRQIQLWDKAMVPVSGILDPLTGYTLGKSLIGVWERT